MNLQPVYKKKIGVVHIEKDKQLWSVRVEPADNQMGLVNTLRSLESLSDQLNSELEDGLEVELDLKNLYDINSALIAQFVMLHQILVRVNGRLKIMNANTDLKSSFDVVMLDKIISIAYDGLDVSDFDLDEE
jgi:hypothetical protein